jgi:alditol oxidase
MVREHNWADNYTFEAGRVCRPTSVEEVRSLVAKSTRIHAIGTRHSFNGSADSLGDLIDLSQLDPPFVVDGERRTVTVGAATTYAAAASHLENQGWALHNMASLPHISVAGATATGTHGSGDKNGSLSTAVAALELVTATGDLIQVNRGSSDFEGMVVGLGAFGIVTRVTLDIQPTFEVQQIAFAGLPWTAALSNLNEIMSVGYSVSLMTKWSGAAVDRLWVKTRVGPQSPLEAVEASLGIVPAARATWRDLDDAAAGLNPFEVVGPWSERLPHFRSDASLDRKQIQSEYMVPRPCAMTALEKLYAMGRRIDRVLDITEIRSMAEDKLWLSPSYGHDSVGIHFTWKSEPEAVHALTSEIEEMLLPLGARPHWGKLIQARADRIAGLYPRLNEFRTLARSYDPNGKFRNEFLDTHVFG